MNLRSRLKLRFMNRDGFSLMELIIAAGIFSMLMLIVSWMMVFFFGRFYQSYGKALIKNDFQLFSKVYFPQLKNAIRLDPGEDLYDVGDAAYRGIIGMSQSVHDCDYEFDNDEEDEARSILRYTVLRNRVGNERVLRGWNDSSSGETGADHELRISYTDTGRQPFQVVGQDKEIAIVDVDGLYTRRFKVDSWARTVGTGLDPFDDQPVTGGDFTYTRLLLLQPERVGGVALDPLDRWFVTHSSVFITSTHVICSKGDKIVDINESTGEERTILDLASGAYALSRFTVSFGATGSGSRVDSRQFKPFRYLSIDERDCFNNVVFRIDVQGRNSGDVDSIELFANLTNLQTRRPLKCDSL